MKFAPDTKKPASDPASQPESKLALNLPRQIGKAKRVSAQKQYDFRQVLMFDKSRHELGPKGSFRCEPVSLLLEEMKQRKFETLDALHRHIDKMNEDFGC